MKARRVRPKSRNFTTSKPAVVAPSYVLEPLDPWLKCGPDTTVTELWKVRERQDRETRFHLVYFDRHGWYCEHGRGCKAVAEVRRVVRGMSATARRPKRSGKARGRRAK